MEGGSKSVLTNLYLISGAIKNPKSFTKKYPMSKIEIILSRAQLIGGPVRRG